MSQSTLTCLRCRNCKLLPDTNMSHRTPVVWCDKKQDRTPLLVANGCGLADPRPRNSKRPEKGGDKTRWASDVEKAWLAACYSATSCRVLMAATGRTAPALKSLARRGGWPPRDRRLKADSSRRRMVESGWAYNAAQREYLQRRHESGDWPRNGPQRDGGRMRREILRDVSALGRPANWIGCVRIANANSPARLRERTAA